jgi:hypothetical protein
MIIHFSNHAFARVRERLSLSSCQVKQLIEDNKTVPLGIEHRSNRTHELFFSVLDNSCFVAVRDNSDGTIITIIPAEWHNKWTISIEAMAEAKRIVNVNKIEKIVTRNIKPIITNRPSKLKVRGHIDYKLVNLGTLDISKYKTADIACKHPDAINSIIAKVNEKEIPINSIDMISINNGGSSEFVQFEIDNYKGKCVLYKI